MEDEHILRYRCHIGHAYSSESLAREQSDALERALGVALRTLEDSASLARRLADEAHQKKRPQSRSLFLHRSEEAKRHAEAIRAVLEEQTPIAGGAAQSEKR